MPPELPLPPTPPLESLLLPPAPAVADVDVALLVEESAPVLLVENEGVSPLVVSPAEVVETELALTWLAFVALLDVALPDVALLEVPLLDEVIAFVTPPPVLAAVLSASVVPCAAVPGAPSSLEQACSSQRAAERQGATEREGNLGSMGNAENGLAYSRGTRPATFEISRR